ncbi:MAG: 50S ribosomal protein L21 [Parachlamydiales bacterium]|nr:50S ribosomal protein L21 [Parachlamydiales bacterium]
MYAVIQSGSKQFQVSKGDTIDIDLIDIPETRKVTFQKVLLCSDGKKNVLGAPYLDNCIVSGDIVKETKGPKVISYRYKRRKNYQRKKGHRQNFVRVHITDIQLQ